MLTNLYIVAVVVCAIIGICAFVYFIHLINQSKNMESKFDSKGITTNIENLFIDDSIRNLERQNMWLEVDRRIEVAIKKHEVNFHNFEE